MKLTSRPTTRQPCLRIERGAPDSPQDLKLPDAALVAVIRRWRAIRAELGLGRLLDEPWRRSA